MVALNQYERDAHLLDGLRTDSLRIDIFMGNEGQPFAHVVDGTAEDMTYHFEELDSLVGLLEEHGVRPYWSWCYIPFPLQQDGDWRKGPVSLEGSGSLCSVNLRPIIESRDFVLPIMRSYNEPDCGDTFSWGLWKITRSFTSGRPGD